jgi:hypothetical protein
VAPVASGFHEASIPRQIKDRATATLVIELWENKNREEKGTEEKKDTERVMRAWSKALRCRCNGRIDVPAPIQIRRIRGMVFFFSLFLANKSLERWQFIPGKKRSRWDNLHDATRRVR